MPTSVRAISWAAVSSKPQAEKESLADQHQLNHALAEARGWQIIVDITVPGESRFYFTLADAQAHIQAYQKLAELVKTGAISWLICKSRDRLARTRQLNHQVADFLQDHGIRIYSRTFPPASLEERTEAEVWSEAIESGYSEAEILRLKQRRERGMQARVRSGKPPAKPPWGFRYVVPEGGDEPIPLFCDPEAQTVVPFLITKFQQGVSKLRILQEANERGYRTPTGRPWTFSTLNNTVFQPAYYGLVAWGRRRTVVEDGRKKRKRRPPEDWLVAEGNFEAPFTQADWERTLQERRRRRDEHPRSRSTYYFLSGIAWCDECEAPMVGATSYGRHYYRCCIYDRYHRPQGRVQAKRHYIRAEELHQQVGEYLRRVAESPEELESLVAEADEQADENWEAEQEALFTRHSDLLRRRRRWGDAYEAGILKLEEFAERLQALEEQETAIERRLGVIEGKLRSQERQENYLAELRQLLAQLPDWLASELTAEHREVFRALFTKFVQRVRVSNNTVIGIEFRIL